MALSVRDYDLKAGSRGRVTVRSLEYLHWHAVVFDHRRIMLEPRAARVPETISVRTLTEVDEAMRQMAGSNLGGEFDLGVLEESIHEDRAGRTYTWP